MFRRDKYKFLWYQNLQNIREKADLITLHGCAAFITNYWECNSLIRLILEEPKTLQITSFCLWLQVDCLKETTCSIPIITLMIIVLFITDLFFGLLGSSQRYDLFFGLLGSSQRYECYEFILPFPLCIDKMLEN